MNRLVSRQDATSTGIADSVTPTKMVPQTVEEKSRGLFTPTCSVSRSGYPPNGAAPPRG